MGVQNCGRKRERKRVTGQLVNIEWNKKNYDESRWPNFRKDEIVGLVEWNARYVVNFKFARKFYS